MEVIIQKKDKTTKNIENPLLFLKFLKSSLCIGLYDAKKYYDQLNEVGIVRINYYNDNIRTLESGIGDFPDINITFTDSCKRNKKILSLGVSEKSEYIDFISEYLVNNNSEYFIREILSNIEKDKLIELIKKIEY